MQDAIANSGHLMIETLLKVCRQQKASDEMLLFIRAVCAAGLMLDPKDSRECLCAIFAEAVPCRSVVAPLPVFPESTSCLLSGFALMYLDLLYGRVMSY